MCKSFHVDRPSESVQTCLALGDSLMRTPKRLLASSAVFLCLVTIAGAQTLNTLFDFTFDSSTGDFPTQLIAGPNGAYYGTALEGGTNNNGVIFEMVPPGTQGGPWTETILYTFNAYPAAGFPRNLVWDETGVLETAGALYGTTADVPRPLSHITPSALP